MTGHGLSECVLGSGDLPAKDFDDKWKNETNFIKFSNAVHMKEKIDKVKDWVYNFDRKILNFYDVNPIDEFIHIQDKRCRDLNYYINYVLFYIPKVTKDTENSKEITEYFEGFVTGIFSSWKNDQSGKKFKCTRMDKDYTTTMDLIKELDDYCENKNAFIKKLEKYDKTVCCKYANHVKDRKTFFQKVILMGHIEKNDEHFHFHDKCTLKDIGETFPDIICNEKNMSETKSNELPLYGHGQLPLTYSEDSLNSSPTKIALTSISTLLGACISGLYLYRHSFIGNMLRNSKNKNIITHENAYDDVNGMFSEGPSHYINTPQANDRFYIAYDAMNN
ncbi:PIR Superfamily Protein [Plasmodium ovale wallikeri]|uniref:PIR Superfamily Protein n=1 Tax=Plasmodium ovale wallikeri TaxID=864142 RepID=A0A1A9ALC8_PLAOA|nr:PIR Superfamily Protein [Plasmodium ovale wallikeri]SBT57600.1 PIR Superfamily Protein [Plasmodium ovale wallikeri]